MFALGVSAFGSELDLKVKITCSLDSSRPVLVILNLVIITKSEQCHTICVFICALGWSVGFVEACFHLSKSLKWKEPVVVHVDGGQVDSLVSTLSIVKKKCVNVCNLIPGPVLINQNRHKVPCKNKYEQKQQKFSKSQMISWMRLCRNTFS